MTLKIYFALLACLVSIPAFAKARMHNSEIDCGDDVADLQGVSTFNSLIDGQPTDPKRPTALLMLSRAEGATQLQTVVQIAPGKKRGACDAVLSLQLPMVTWDDRVHLGQSAGFGWEQRWHADDANLPTLATSVSAVIDHSQPKLGLQLNGTLIAAKTVGKMVFYGNIFINYAKAPGNNATWTPGFVLGIKAPARAEDAFVIDLFVVKDEPAVLEFGYQLAAPDHFNIGPGFSITLKERPQLTVGLVIQREF